MLPFLWLERTNLRQTTAPLGLLLLRAHHNV